MINNESQEIEQLKNELAESKKQLADAIYKSEYLDNLIAILPGHIYWLDCNNVYLGCNDSEAELAGLGSRKDMIGKRNCDLVWSDQAEALDKLNQEVINLGRGCVIEESAYIKGEQKFFISHKVPLRDGNNNIVGVVGLSIDITKRKKLEKELFDAKVLAEKADKSKTEFILNMNHDIKIPFAGIMGLTQCLQDQETVPEKKECLKYIQQSSKQLLDLINNIIDLVDTDTNYNKTDSEFNIKFLVHNLASLMQATIKHKNIQLRINVDNSIPNLVRTKKNHINRVLLNLVGNAIKFTHQGSVSISLTILQQKENLLTLKLVVTDTGIGISEENQSRIFEKFLRLTPSFKSEYAGSGLGLWAVKNAIQELGGEISVQSEQGQGSTFTCVFPCQTVSLNSNLLIKSLREI
jgi:two-component system aerobic respiration control sensor histidine kinase ArcB